MRRPVPPPRWYRNIANVPSGARCFETIRYSPSGAHAGELMICGRSLVVPSVETAFGSDPSAFAIHRFSTPLRSERKATCLPSGEKRGWLSNDIPPTMRRASPPLAGTT
jgi:hypothetical protein